MWDTRRDLVADPDTRAEALISQCRAAAVSEQGGMDLNDALDRQARQIVKLQLAVFALCLEQAKGAL